MPNHEFTYHFALIRPYRRGFRGLAQYPLPAFAGRHDGLDHGVGHPRLPLDHATALQHRRQGMGEDADVMLSEHTWPRRSARPMSASRGSPEKTTLQLCMLQTSATSAWPPILCERLRLGGCTAYRHGAVHRRTTSALTTLRQLLVP